jgi:hypothetical protein
MNNIDLEMKSDEVSLDNVGFVPNKQKNENEDLSEFFNLSIKKKKKIVKKEETEVENVEKEYNYFELLEIQYFVLNMELRTTYYHHYL